MAVCLALSLSWARHDLATRPPVYGAEMRVGQIERGSDVNSSRANSAPGLRFITTMYPAAGDEIMQFQLFLSSIQTEDLARELAKDQGLMHALFPAEWNSAARRWEEPPLPLMARMEKAFAPIMGPQPVWQPPNPERLHDLLNVTVRALPDQKNPQLATIYAHSWDKTLAVRLLNAVFDKSNYLLRSRALARARANRAYFSRIESDSKSFSVRQAAISEVNQEDFSEISDSLTAPFAADMLDSPQALNEPLSSHPVQVYFTAAFIGLLCGAALVLLQGTLRAPASRIPRSLSMFLSAGHFRWKRR